ncbi:MAG: hypothetical protein A2039_03255 [Candidatus Melainabacteria bacterium GWA2_34_9]|nr:MAG: hypothetical protein A2039_03255 [Candidatus Melainabacteria bacterium GWA2_34_9]
MQKQLIIIGGVAAGTKAAAKARRESPDLKITLYTESRYISYSACGMPYYIENLIKDEKRLIVRTPEYFKEREDIDIHIKHKVTRILPEENKVEVENLETGEKFIDEYSKLLIATGSRAFVPDIEGVKLQNVFVLKDIDDAVEIKKNIKQSKKVVIVGGGYIGLELLESFKAHDTDLTMIDRSQQILNTFDLDISSHIQNYLIEEKNINIITNESMKRLIGDSKSFIKQVETSRGKIINADMVILALGVRPNIELAKEAGIEIGETGAIKVNERMQTNFPDVFAAGDCVETINIVTDKSVWIPLGSTANKMGRIAAINITGGYEEFKGITGSMVVKIFDYTASKTGLSEKEAKELGYDYVIAILMHRDKSGYMPDAKEITIKMIAEKSSGRILGAQVIGKGDADKRVNVVAAALTANMTVKEFMGIDLTYAPPYSPSIDPILIAAQMLYSKLKKEVGSITPEELQKHLKQREKAAIIDIRTPSEFKAWHIENSQNVLFEDLEEKIGQANRETILCCEGGMESYLLTLQLMEKGYQNIRFVDGGMNFYKNL